ncbi:hypothetical protein GGR42_001318 [Saonia flava]|uniref:Uncharacterized protein n=1 Tax=Saonia flava TaxID=523696 RepID=A0A846QP61_9FLAO|nr:hypothetical protein [Saonia flava]
MYPVIYRAISVIDIAFFILLDFTTFAQLKIIEI